jgi:hypothetical protein
VQNHEIGNSDPNPALAALEFTYDPKAKGGTTTLTLDRDLDPVDQYVIRDVVVEVVAAQPRVLGDHARITADFAVMPLTICRCTSTGISGFASLAVVW